MSAHVASRQLDRLGGLQIEPVELQLPSGRLVIDEEPTVTGDRRHKIVQRIALCVAAGQLHNQPPRLGRRKPFELRRERHRCPRGTGRGERAVTVRRCGHIRGVRRVATHATLHSVLSDRYTSPRLHFVRQRDRRSGRNPQPGRWLGRGFGTARCTPRLRATDRA